MIAYNVENYIGQAIESVMMQRTNFPFELLISEDCSTDATRDVAMAYARRYPDRIRLLLSERNLNSTEVVIRGFREAAGDYIALLDADDYWTSRDKLQMQVDFLDSHPECATCIHNAVQQFEVEIDRNAAFYKPAPFSTQADLIEHGCFPETSSVLFRNGLVTSFPSWFRSLKYCDWVLHLLHAEHGAIGYLDVAMSVRRVHAGGIWTGMDQMRRAETLIEACTNIRSQFPRYTAVLGKTLAGHWYGLGVAHMREGNAGAARECARRAWRERVSLKPLLLWLSPGLWQLTRRVMRGDAG
jgi:glycosyltransferase involved in cell wall biosynthesis